MAGEESIEVEVRRVLVGPARAEALAGLAALRELGGATWSGFELREQRDRYFDLPGGELAAADRALRLREVGGGTLLTCKGPAEVHEGSVIARAEVEGPWSADALERALALLEQGGLSLPVPPPELGAPEPVLRALGLVEVQLRETTRRAARLERGGVGVAELALDEVRYRAGSRRVLHREVELEALGGTEPDGLLELVRGLEAGRAADLRPWPWSKTALGVALEALEAGGELAALVIGEELTPAGYDRVDGWLSAQRG